MPTWRATLERYARVPRIVAVVDAENLRSARVAEQIGMAVLDTVVGLNGRPHTFYALRRAPAA